MQYDPFRHHRRSIRLPSYDYSSQGAYFLTLCSSNKECLFGEVVDGSVVLSLSGQIVAEEWLRSGSLRQEVVLDTYVVMPNHLHGIVVIVCQGAYPSVGASGARPDARSPRLPKRSIGAFVAGFKSSASRRINALPDSANAPVWQRNYYEHVIRDDDDYHRIQAYIEDNPRRWAEDEYHPGRASKSPRPAR